MTLASNCQSKKTYNPSQHITYVTEGRDTLFIISNIYSLFDEIWNQPENVNEKPILVSVQTLAPYYTGKSKNSKDNKKSKKDYTTTRINNKKSKKKKIK